MRNFFWALLAATMLTACGNSTGTVTIDLRDNVQVVDIFEDSSLPLPDIAEVTPEVWVLDLVDDMAADTVPLDLAPEAGEPGAPCDTGSDCLSGYCIPTPDGFQCTTVCEEECPFGWTCALHEASAPDVVYICAPADESLP